MSVVYPGSTPEFRTLEKLDGTQVLQIRYVNETQKYVSRWQDIPTVKEEMLNGNESRSKT